MELARSLSPNRLEVISADSRQIYRGLDIGTAKPSVEMRAAVPHHLIDIVAPRDTFSAGDFVRHARQIMRDIWSRGAIGIIVGGAAFYVRSLLFGLPETPPADAAVRLELKERAAQLGLGELYAQLQRLDPATAARLHRNDRSRILRALEILATSGQPLSRFRRPIQPPRTGELLLMLLRRPRDLLYQRIEQRVDAMFADGLVVEVAGLLHAGHDYSTPGLRSIGYAEFFGSRGDFRGEAAQLADVASRIKGNSRHYAKRQMTFFRGLPATQWIDMDDAGVAVQTATSVVRQFLDTRATALDSSG